MVTGSGKDVSIGNNPNDAFGDRRFDGQLDEVRVYDKALSVAEIGELQNTAPIINSGTDTLSGGNGDDTIHGNGGDDTINGGLGQDTLYGETGADTFIFEAASAFAQTDTVMDFSVVEGDILDISDLITAGTVNAGNVTDYIQFTDSGADTIVAVDVNGAAGGVNFQTIATFDGIAGLDEVDLFNNGQLIV